MDRDEKVEIRYVLERDKAFWFTLDQHLSADEFGKKIRDKQGYVLFFGKQPAAILRYNLFWDNTPFCTLLFVAEKYRRRGFGKKLMGFWEKEMQSFGYGRLLVSTRVDESAQYFYRAIGYTDCGGLIVPRQPMEIFFGKDISYIPH